MLHICNFQVCCKWLNWLKFVAADLQGMHYLASKDTEGFYESHDSKQNSAETRQKFMPPVDPYQINIR